ncbi:MAG: hypothetical protein RL227_1262 [Pseudomonadota bacterium]
MNLLQLVQRLHREAGRSGDGPTSIVGTSKQHQRLFDWVADANRELESRPLDLRWMRRRVTIATVATTTALTSYAPRAAIVDGGLGLTTFGRWRPPSDEWAPRVVDPTDATRTWDMEHLPLDDWRDAYVHSTQVPSRPGAWSVDDDDSLLIGPTPDAAYNIRIEYLRTPLDLAADTDVPEFGAEFHMILCWRALIEVGKFDNASDILARAQTNYARLEDSLLSRYTRKMTWGAPLA